MSSDGKNGMVAVYQLIGEDAGRLRRRRRRLPRLWRRITRRGERFDSQPNVFWTYTVPMSAPATPDEIQRMRERFARDDGGTQA